MTDIESRKPAPQKVWAYPLPVGTRVVVRYKNLVSGGFEYYAGTVLKWSKLLKQYYIKGADGKTYTALSGYVKPFDTTTIEGLEGWLVIAEKAPQIASAFAVTSMPDEEDE